jgi:CRISPR type IV-associated protein Csf3
MQGFKLTGYLTKAYSPSIDGAVHLDSLITKALCVAENRPPVPENTMEIIDIPVFRIWEDQEGKPLWATTNLIPIEGEPVFKSMEYWHKRFPERRIIDYCKKPNTATRRGRYKEYRIPVQVQFCRGVEAYGIGDIERISELIQHVTHIGKKWAQGKGRVVWEIEEWGGDEVKIENICMGRTIPLEFYQKKDKSKMLSKRRVMTRGAWTPPYWYRPWFSPCVTFK